MAPRLGATGSPDKFPGSTLKARLNSRAGGKGNPGPVTRTAVARLSRTKTKLPSPKGNQAGAKPVVLRSEQSTYGPIA